MPREFRNTVTPAIATNGGVYVLLQTESEVRRYSRDGQLLWRQSLQVPEVDDALREFFQESTAEENPSAIWPPRTMTAGRTVGGDLCILMLGAATRPSVFYILASSTGRLREPAIP